MNRKSLIELKRSDGGDKCPICGVQLTEDNTALDHIVPLSLGGTSTLHNLRLVCDECNKKKSFWGFSAHEFEKFMCEVISKNENFRNTKTNVILGKEIEYMPDIVTERISGEEWEKLVIEIKFVPALTMDRVFSTINQFKRYSNSITGDEYSFCSSQVNLPKKQVSL